MPVSWRKLTVGPAAACLPTDFDVEFPPPIPTFMVRFAGADLTLGVRFGRAKHNRKSLTGGARLFFEESAFPSRASWSNAATLLRQTVTAFLDCYPAGTVIIGAPSLPSVSVSVNTNIRNENSDFDRMSRSSIQNQ